MHSNINIKEIARLQKHYLTYKVQFESGSYKEMALRNDFINNLLIAIGWDVDNKSGHNPIDREVLVEETDLLGRRPDYIIRIDRKPKFIIEVKEPSKDCTSKDAIFQAKSYAYSSTESPVAFVVLTNFRQLLIFDGSIVPDYEHPLRGLIGETLEVENFLTKKGLLVFEKLSKNQVSIGILESEIQANLKNPFRIPPDKKLFDILNTCRKKLGSSLNSSNKNISLEEITDWVGTFINRILFIRILEDRGTLNRRELRDIVDSCEEDRGSKPATLIKMIQSEFEFINENFNGKLFHKNLFISIKIDPHILVEVIKGLYGPKCPFAFQLIDACTLGRVYEQFLSLSFIKQGKEIKLEYKPEVRSSGGIFYTPIRVVELMANEAINTVAEKEININNIKILDPACGSGSFLVASYKKLLSFEARKKSISPEKLPFDLKRKILLSSIFGVDIDKEAIKVATLSLCLAALEGEEHISHGKRLLPDLYNNLLIYDSVIHEKIENREPFNIDEYIPDKKNLIVLSNPPYLSTKRGFIKSTYKTNIEENYDCAVDQWDIYSVFLERSLNWCPLTISMIVPRPILTNISQKEIRKKLVNEGLNRIINVGEVFEDCAVETVILFANRQSEKIIITEKLGENNIEKIGKIEREKIENGEVINIYAGGNSDTIFKELENQKNRWKEKLACTGIRGIETGKKSLETLQRSGGILCYSGSEVKNTKLPTPSRFIVPDWNDKTKFKDKIAYQGPKILVRRVSNSLIAALDQSNHVCLNTLYIFKFKNLNECMVATCLVNSKLIQFWFKYKYVNDDNLFPYVRKNQIEDIPLPNKWEEFVFENAKIAKKIINSTNPKDEDIFNNSAAKYYGISSNYSKTIDDYFIHIYDMAI